MLLLQKQEGLLKLFFIPLWLISPNHCFASWSYCLIAALLNSCNSGESSNHFDHAQLSFATDWCEFSRLYVFHAQGCSQFCDTKRFNITLLVLLLVVGLSYGQFCFKQICLINKSGPKHFYACGCWPGSFTWSTDSCFVTTCLWPNGCNNFWNSW